MTAPYLIGSGTGGSVSVPSSGGTAPSASDTIVVCASGGTSTTPTGASDSTGAGNVYTAPAAAGDSTSPSSAIFCCPVPPNLIGTGGTITASYSGSTGR